MKTFDIGIDLDGVGYNLQASLAPYARKQGYQLASEPSWNRINPDTGKHGGFASWGIRDYDEFSDLCSEASVEGTLYASGAPFAGFVSMMRTLASDGHRLHIITARTKDPESKIAHSTRAWLGEWVIPHRSLSFSADKTQHHTDLFIEDSTFNYASLLETGMTVPFLVSRSWNLNFDATNRVEHLADFTSEVRRRAHPLCIAMRGSQEMVFQAPPVGPV